MTAPRLDAPVMEQAPTAPSLTEYDRLHLITYVRLLDAAEAQADWREVARIVLGIDPTHEPERARGCYDTHLARARWMTEAGYRDLLGGARPA